LIVMLWMRSHPHAPAYYIGVVVLITALTLASQPTTLPGVHGESAR
jgi:hypothetical protein